MERVILLLIASVLAGCQLKGEPRAEAPGGPAWWPRAASMRVYPSTRFVTQGEDALLEARIELVDEMGDPIKAPGVFRLELFSEVEGDEAARQLYAWRVRVMTLEEHRSFYDPITRVYLMRLRLDPRAIREGEPRLRVLFTPAEGSRLQTEAALRQP